MRFFVGAILGGMLGIILGNGNLAALGIGAVIGGFLGWISDQYEGRDWD